MEHNKFSFEDLVGASSLEELQPYGINSASGLFKPYKGTNDLSEERRKRIEEIRKATIDKIITKRVKGSQMLKDFRAKTRIFETGVEPFDDLFRSEDHILGSYLHWGDVVEIVGESDSGKTDLIQHILTVDDSCYDIAYFIDTKNKFSASKLYAMMGDFNFTDDKIKGILKKIQVYKNIDDLDKLYLCLLELNKIQITNHRKLIVIDSIVAPVCLYMGDTQLINTLLVDVMHEINKLTKNNSTFLITNLASFPESKTGFVNECKPFCGSFWSSFADHKILVSQDNGYELLRSKHFSPTDHQDESQDTNSS